MGEQLQMMKRVRSIIAEQQRTLEVVVPKAQMYDRLGVLIDMLNDRGRGYSHPEEDILRTLDKRIEELTTPRPPVGI